MYISKYEEKHTMYITLLFTLCSEEKYLPHYSDSVFWFAFEIEAEAILSMKKKLYIYLCFLASR